MTAPSVLRVVTPAGWLAADLARGTDHGSPWDPATEPHPGGLAVVHDLGLWAPEQTDDVAWWMPGSHAQRLRASGLDPVLLTPGPRAITSFDRDFLRRRVEVMTLGEAALRCGSYHQPVFAKPADIKLPSLPARVWPSLEHFVDAARGSRLADTAAVIISDPVEHVREVRCHILDGRCVAVSNYLDQGHTWDAMHPSDALYVNAREIGFASEAVDSMNTPPPRGFVLDIGQDRHGRWSVIETNPAWSSNPYWATEERTWAVVQTILASQDPHSPGERWGQDGALRVGAKPLPVRSTAPVPRT